MSTDSKQLLPKKGVWNSTDCGGGVAQAQQAKFQTPFLGTNWQFDVTRRQFLGRSSLGIGTAALATLLAGGSSAKRASASPGLAGLPHAAPKARRVIWLTQAGAPSQLD